MTIFQRSLLNKGDQSLEFRAGISSVHDVFHKQRGNALVQPASGDADTELNEVELERVMREKLGADQPRPLSYLDEAARRLAQNFLGATNLERLAKAEQTGRRFRPVPVVVHYEYWWVHGNHYSMGHWRMARVENGKRTDHEFSGPVEDEISRLKDAGYTVREIRIDGAPSLIKRSHGTMARRKSFAERYGSIHIGGRT